MVFLMLMPFRSRVRLFYCLTSGRSQYDNYIGLGEEQKLKHRFRINFSFHADANKNIQTLNNNVRFACSNTNDIAPY